MNEPINEYGLAKRITQHLDYGTSKLDGHVQFRLQAARQHALEAYAKPHHHFSLAWGGHGGRNGHHRGHSPFRAWLPLAALLLGLMFITYWQSTEQMNDLSEIDAHLLAEELPFHAFIDTGFDTWLKGSSEE